jgi:insulysin
VTTADTDATHITALTKKDMTDFYAHYISTTSPARAKLSVHLQAQSKPKEPSLQEKKDAAVTALTALFAEHKITTADADAVKTSIAAVSSPSEIPTALSAYLDSLSLASETKDTVLDGAKAALGVADAGLPAEPKVEGDGESEGAGQPVLIKDVYAWKAGMQVSAGVKPVRPLEEFVDIAEHL